MKKIAVLSIATITALLSFNAGATDILARVISSAPVVQQVAVPRQICSNQPVVIETPNSGGGAVLGAVAGGAVGNAIGNGSGRALATMIGLVGGAMAGDRIEGNNTQVQNMQQCSTQTFYENRASHYNVVYEYQGTQYNTQMAMDPGPYVRLQVTPVGAVSATPQPGFAAQAQTYVQPVPQQAITTYVQPTYVQPVVAVPVIYPAPPPVYYSQPYYPPLGLSLNFGYSHGYRHWR